MPSLRDALVPLVPLVPLVVSFDIDGTMEFGDPPGPVPVGVVLTLLGRGIVVGVASDWPLFSQPSLWALHGMTPYFFGSTTDFNAVRLRHPAERYLHVGRGTADQRSARSAGFEFVDVRRLVLPVTPRSIVGP